MTSFSLKGVKLAPIINFRRTFSEGMGELAERLHEGEIAPADVADRFQMAYDEALLRVMMQQYPELAQFDGQTHEQHLEQFRNLDRARIALARQQVASVHYASLPRGGADIGQLGLLRREMEKKRKHLPLRRLLKEAGNAVQAIKPVFMMSPLSVAQYLEPGALSFDLLLIDEASQVRPVDALWARLHGEARDILRQHGDGAAAGSP